MNGVTSFCCDLISAVHYDFINSVMTLKMTLPAVVINPTFIFFINLLLVIVRLTELFPTYCCCDFSCITECV